MPTYIGENKIVDRYLGDKFLEAAYIGDKKVYDPYTEIAGYLPIIYKSRAAVALKNYRIYGTSAGAGVETENLFDYAAQDPENGYREGRYLVENGASISGSEWNISEYITVNPNTTYTINQNQNSSTPSVVEYDENKQYIIGYRYNRNSAVTIVASATTKYVRASIRTSNLKTATITPSSTAPSTYIPHGYKLPLTVESGAQSQDIPIYIGSSKLGKEEYVDFGEQKVYKRTENLFDPTNLVNGKGIDQNGNIADSPKRICTPNRISVSGSSMTVSYVLSGSAPSWLNIRFIAAVYDGVTLVARTANNTNRTVIDITGGDNILITWYAAATDYVLTIDDIKDIMLTLGSTPPETFIPYLQPTDPPVPLPPIPTYKGENTLSSTETLGEVTVKGRIKERPIVYGWHIDPSVSDPAQAVTYLQDAVGKTPAAMGASTFSYGDWENAFFMPKPCMLRYDGTVAYYLDPNDYTKKADGTPSDVANASFDGNAMMEWPLIWYKFEAGTIDGEGYFYCSNKQVDDTYHCWCNYDCDDNIIDHFYTAIYNGTGTEKMRSLSGIQLTPANGNGSATGQQEVTRATANNTTSDIEWYTDVYSDRQLISALLILMSKCLDDQAAYGRGLDTGLQTAAESYITGTLNDKGLFYGVTANGDNAVKVFGMENWFGCKWRRTAGLIGGANDTYLYKLTYGTADGSTVNGYNSNGQGYLTANGVSRPANNYVTKMGMGKHGLLPKETAAVSSSSYYGVYYYNGSGYALFVGSSDSGRRVGSLSVYLHRGFSYSNWSIGASLSCKPTKKS